jgi:signal transduction histidine kinase
MRIPLARGILWGLGLAVVVAEEYFRKTRNELRSRNKALEQGLAEKNKALREANLALQEEINERRQAEEQLTFLNRQLRELSANLQSVREEERTRIAREIHDVLGQQLTVLKLDISWLSKRLVPGELQDKTQMMLASVDETLQVVRKIATELRPGVLDDLGLIAAIEWQCREFESRFGIKCTLDTEIHELETSHEISTAVFRVFQETLTNILRHAKASRAEIRISISNDTLGVTISDNGRGITEEEITQKNSLGLLGMKERMLSIGGDILITGIPGAGTVVRLVIPLQRQSCHG